MLRKWLQVLQISLLIHIYSVCNLLSIILTVSAIRCKHNGYVAITFRMCPETKFRLSLRVVTVTTEYLSLVRVAWSVVFVACKSVTGVKIKCCSIIYIYLCRALCCVVYYCNCVYVVNNITVSVNSV